MNIAIIGYGGMAGYHERKIKGLADEGYNIKLIGIYDIDKSRDEVAKEHGLHAYASAEEIFADEKVDTVLIATPNDFHCPYAVAAANAKKNVISEKPVSLNTEETKAMFDAAKKNGVLMEVHQNRRWDRDFLTIKKLYDEKTLGEIYRLESRVMGSNGIPGGWRKKKAQGGGMILDWGVHMIDQALMMVDSKITDIYCRTSFIYGEDCDDGFQLDIGFENGVTFRVVVDTNTFVSLPRWQAYGMDGTATIKNWDAANGCQYTLVKERVETGLRAIEAGNGLTKTMSPRSSKTVDDFSIPLVDSDWKEFYINFMEAAEGKAEPFIKEEQVLRVMKVMELAFESARTNSVIKELF